MGNSNRDCPFSKETEIQSKFVGGKTMTIEPITINDKLGNESAISLYEKLGFKKYATFQDNMKYTDGSYCDAYGMMKKLVRK